MSLDFFGQILVQVFLHKLSSKLVTVTQFSHTFPTLPYFFVCKFALPTLLLKCGKFTPDTDTEKLEKVLEPSYIAPYSSARHGPTLFRHHPYANTHALAPPKAASAALTADIFLRLGNKDAVAGITTHHPPAPNKAPPPSSFVDARLSGGGFTPTRPLDHAAGGYRCAARPANLA